MFYEALPTLSNNKNDKSGPHNNLKNQQCQPPKSGVIFEYLNGPLQGKVLRTRRAGSGVFPRSELEDADKMRLFRSQAR
jgi:hypothetical protein